MRSGGAIPPLQKGRLSDACAIPYENKANGCETPLCDTISKGHCAIWGGISHWAAFKGQFIPGVGPTIACGSGILGWGWSGGESRDTQKQTETYTRARTRTRAHAHAHTGTFTQKLHPSFSDLPLKPEPKCPTSSLRI